MLKVATISTNYKGGAGKAAYRVHEGLVGSSGIEAVFLQTEPPGSIEKANNVIQILPPKLTLAQRVLAKLGVEPYQFFKNKKKLADNPRDYEIATFAQTDYRVEGSKYVKEADIIHLHWVADFINYPTFFKSVTKPIVWTLHDMNPFQGLFHYKGDHERNSETFGKLDQKVYNQKRKALLANQNIHIVCLSEWMMQESKKSEFFNRFPHYLIPNGLNFAHYGVIDPQTSKKKLGIDNRQKTLLFLAQDIKSHRKGFDLLLSALNESTFLNANIITVGGAKIELPGNYNHIHFELIKEDYKINEIYSAADLVLLCSREDNLPNVMLEAFANGTPVLSFSLGGMKEYIKHGENGILVYNVTSEALSKAISGFLSSSDAFDRSRIRAFAKEHFSDTAQLGGYMDLYRNIHGK